MQQSIESRVTQIEIEQRGFKVQQDNLTSATKENTVAIKGLTDSIGQVLGVLSYNKGAFWGAFKTASAGTVIVGAAFSFMVWIAGIHLGK